MSRSLAPHSPALLFVLAFGCDSAKTSSAQAPPTNVPSAAPSANVTLGDTTMNGATFNSVSCHAANANPFTALAMMSPLANQKAALDRCGAKADVAIHFVVSGQKVSDVRVAGAPTPEAAACIAKEVTAAAWTEDLVCVVKMPLGG